MKFKTSPSPDEVLNPVAISGSAARNQVLMVDLGATFKIDTVKIWNRLSDGQVSIISSRIFLAS